MRPFNYTPATIEDTAINLVARNPRAKFIAGGTNLIDLMRERVEQPEQLIDITGLSLAEITELPGGGISLGALARNTQVADHPLVRTRFPAVSQAIVSGATQQLRNMASTGGNLMQRTRCYYFYDTTTPCNKREPGSGCSALEGFNHIHAILGTNENCIATHPSDMCVPLAALDAVVRVRSPRGERRIPFTEFHRLPGDTPHIDTNLQRDELITHIDIPALPFAAKSYYLKVRERASYAFALVSVACALDIQSGTIRSARVAMGGVSHKPWRAVEAERVLIGAPATEATYKQAAEAEMRAARGYEHNRFKIELGKRTLVRALSTVAKSAC